MTYQQRNATVTLIVLSLILGYFLTRVFLMMDDGGLVREQLFRLWITVIVAVIVVNIVGIIAANILHGVVSAAQGEEPTYVEDERDKLFELKGIRVKEIVTSIGTFGAMLTFALGEEATLMFVLLVVASLLGSMAAEIARLFYYQRGY